MCLIEVSDKGKILDLWKGGMPLVEIELGRIKHLQYSSELYAF
jgi:hypothetical protein